METISIETDGRGGYQVRAVQNEGPDHIYGGFPTWTDARSWADKRWFVERWVATPPTLNQDVG